MPETYGPSLPISEEIQAKKHRLIGESFREQTARIANALKDSEQHYRDFRDMLLRQAFLPGGRVQSAVGSPRTTTAFNCFVSMTIPDSMDGIMDAAKEAAQTMRLGGGIGYDFSTIRPAGDLIVSLDSSSSGVLSFMKIFDSICSTVSSAGHRRGAQMGVLRVDHPDIEAFIEAKTNEDQYKNFNLSIAVTDEFMIAVEENKEFELVFNNRVYKRVNAPYLFDKMMRATFDWAEPGILFIDRINGMNNLWYCETIAATNPCKYLCTFDK
jgi:ribonucleoside-diphosphate reductase alpha chain